MSRRAIRAVVTVIVTTFVSCGRPPLTVTTESRSVIIDMQTLGEYPSDVARLRLTEAAANRVVWEVRGRDEPQLGSVRLHAGENDAAVADVRHGSYDVLTPAGGSTFTLEPGKRYVVEVWGRDGVARTKRKVAFTLVQ